jgi:hypothetical protein
MKTELMLRYEAETGNYQQDDYEFEMYLKYVGWLEAQLTWRDASETPDKQGGYFVNHGLSAIKSIQTTGVGGDSEMKTSIKIYPNPSTEIFNIRISDLTGFQNLLGLATDWEITNTHGSIIAIGNNKVGDFSIDLSSHPKGIYYLKISQGGLQFTEKLVLQ